MRLVVCVFTCACFTVFLEDETFSTEIMFWANVRRINYTFANTTVLYINWDFLGVLSQIECTGFLTNSTGMISAPDADGDGLYENKLSCLWIIEVKDSQSIKIEFLEIDIEDELVCEYDRVKVSDGLIPKVYHCGTEVPPIVITDSRLAVVEFRSDGSVTKKGFKAVYSLIEDPTCGYRTWRNSGYFGSHDTDLKPGLCTWAIQGGRYYAALHVLIYNMSLVPSPGCEEEYVQVYNDKEILLEKHCQPDVMPVITTTENVLYVDLKSNAVNEPGYTFQAYYATTDVARTCGNITTQPLGLIRSLDRNNDGDYDSYLNCVWTLVAPNGYVVRLEFHDFDVEQDPSCRYDFVAVFDGPFEYGASVGTFCGDALPPVIWSTANIMVVQFFSDEYNPEHEVGFNATYSHHRVAEKPGAMNPTTHKPESTKTETDVSTENTTKMTTAKATSSSDQTSPEDFLQETTWAWGFP